MRHASPVLIDSGPYVIRKADLATVCTHESGHAIAHIAIRGAVKSVEVSTKFSRWPDGRSFASCEGVCRVAPSSEVNIIDGEPDIATFPFVDAPKAHACWRAFRPSVFTTLAGPAAEIRYRMDTGLPRGNFSCDDAAALKYYKRLFWTYGARDAHAFERLVWHQVCRFVSDPKIWRAIQKVDGELFRGLIHQEPVDPRPGDEIKFALDGETIAALAAEAGLTRIEPFHECGEACMAPRSTPRRLSHRWQGYLADWKKEQDASAAA